MKYKTIERFNNANIKQTICTKCSVINKKRIRICPNLTCKAIITYKSKRGYFSSKKKNSLCRKCSAKENNPWKGKSSNRKGCKLTKEQCLNISNYITGLRVGKNHPMYGKKHSDETRKKISKMLSGKNNPMYGKHHSNEVKTKISASNMGKPGPVMTPQGLLRLRLKRIQEIEIDKNNGIRIIPSINKSSCKIFDEINKILGWSGQHGLSILGEFYIKDLGYWVDYYESNLNIVIEYDEKKHYKNNQLKEKDVIRQKEITEYLGCKFYRIKESEFNLEKLIDELKSL